jgi:hypothetical protein
MRRHRSRQLKANNVAAYYLIRHKRRLVAAMQSKPKAKPGPMTHEELASFAMTPADWKDVFAW